VTDWGKMDFQSSGYFNTSVFGTGFFSLTVMFVCVAPSYNPSDFKCGTVVVLWLLHEMWCQRAPYVVIFVSSSKKKTVILSADMSLYQFMF